jgi:uncharacterized protein
MEIETKNDKYLIIGDLGLLINSGLRDDFKCIKYEKIKENDIIKDLRKELTNEEILINLSSCTSVVLGVTEACNFRCRYCSYSGKYIDERVHNKKKMDFETARLAVDLFFKMIYNNTRKKKSSDIYIGFYGGECLLEFDLIKDVIEYTEKAAMKKNLTNRFNILYRLTTNGYLLTDKIVDFFKEKDVIVDVSLDGPEEEHNKFRVTNKGEKTWEKIMNNLNRIKQRHPHYYESQINYKITLHPHHDFKAIDRFFSDNPHMFKDERISFNSVNLEGLKKDEKDKLKIKAINPGDLRFLKAARDINFKFNLKNKSSIKNFTGTCFPGGDKLFVDTDGQLNICEKIKQKAPKIGDVRNGFDFDNIRRIVRDFNEEIIKMKCWKCDCWFLCNICLANSFKNGRFNIDCKVEKNYHRLLKKYLEDLEEKEKKNDKNNSNTYDNIADFIDGL